ncbi:MAG: hypothetical protein QOJ81_185 [Chloroflexota bacterium]|jgi:predicted short-subunit dehydrogenase-like oxidoreductase (DUF2520 family)|nr:hypothetical protein [Chloroflexota bacterium]
MTDHKHDHQQADDGKPRIGFIGAGRVGTALGVAFSRAGWEVTGVASRDEARRASFHSLVPTARAFEDAANVLDEADLIFLTVPDDAIVGAAESLHLYSGQALVHTSGALPAAVLTPAMAAGTSKASFHPLVAFADLEHALEALHGATVALDGDESLLPVLADLAESIGARAVRLPEGGKTAYHAAAMMAAGGLVGLLDGIAAVARLAGLDEKTALGVYLPLARQTLANSERFGIDHALTGPFMRGDVGTVHGHLDMLRASAPEALNLYVAVARHELAIARRRARLDPAAADTLEALLDAAEQGD